MHKKEGGKGGGCMGWECEREREREKERERLRQAGGWQEGNWGYWLWEMYSGGGMGTVTLYDWWTQSQATL